MRMLSIRSMKVSLTKRTKIRPRHPKKILKLGTRVWSFSIFQFYNLIFKQNIKTLKKWGIRHWRRNSQKDWRFLLIRWGIRVHRFSISTNHTRSWWSRRIASFAPARSNLWNGGRTVRRSSNTWWKTQIGKKIQNYQKICQEAKTALNRLFFYTKLPISVQILIYLKKN